MTPLVIRAEVRWRSHRHRAARWVGRSTEFERYVLQAPRGAAHDVLADELADDAMPIEHHTSFLHAPFNPLAASIDGSEVGVNAQFDPPQSARLEVAIHFVLPELRLERGPDIGRLVPFAGPPLFADLVHVSVIFDPAAPWVAYVVEKIGGERVTTRSVSFLVAGFLQLQRAEGNIVDAVHLEAAVLETAVRA